MQKWIEQSIPLGTVAVWMRGEPTVVLMDPYRDAETLLNGSGEADVVEVAVGEEQGSDVGNAATDRGETVSDGVPCGRVAGVHQGDGVTVNDHVAVGVRVLDEIDIVADQLHTWQQPVGSSRASVPRSSTVLLIRQ